MRNPTSEGLITLSRWYVRHAPGSLWKVRLAGEYLNPRLRDQPRRRVTRSRIGVKFDVDTHDLIQRYIYMFGIWEPHMTGWLRRRLRPGDTFVDVGAHVGYISMLASRLVGDTGRVVAIEASPTFHERLRHHVDLNACSNVRAVNAAVSDTRETLTFILASSINTGANSIVPYDGPAESVFEAEASPLPDLLESDEIAKARVIKVDVEGAEGKVARGMAPLLDKLRPDAEVTIEVTPERMEQLGDSVNELLEIMTKAGFHAYRLVNEYAPETYPPALRRPPAVPIRLRGPVEGETDLIFSKTDADRLP